jgi:hypothetical protein
MVIGNFSTSQVARKRRGLFFPLMAWVMLVIVFFGFAPTLYLRVLGTEQLPAALQKIPGHLYSHGAALTAWFLLFCTQATLIALRRPNIHRTLGLLASIAAIAVVVTTLITIQQAIAHPVRVSLGDNPVMFFMNALGVLQFAVLVVCGILFRNRSETHKRLMYLASVPLLSAAISRLPGAVSLPVAAVANVSLIFLLLLIARDLLSDRKLHPATIWGGIVLIIVPRLFFIPFGLSPLGKRIVDALA